MLMLSKRPKESLSFPEAGITIHFLRVHSGTVRLGVEANPEIEIVQAKPDHASVKTSLETNLESRGFVPELPKELRHGIRNELHSISVGLHLLREQLRMGMSDEADETFQFIKESLKTLDENELLQSPSTA